MTNVKGSVIINTSNANIDNAQIAINISITVPE